MVSLDGHQARPRTPQGCLGFPAGCDRTWWIGAAPEFTPAPGRVTASHQRLPGYSTGSLRAGIEDNHKGLEFFANNISNTRGLTYYLSDGGAGQTGQASIIAPTTIGLLLRTKL